MLKNKRQVFSHTKLFGIKSKAFLIIFYYLTKT